MNMYPYIELNLMFITTGRQLQHNYAAALNHVNNGFILYWYFRLMQMDKH